MTGIAHTYGQALYDLAKEEGLTARILEQITVLNDSFAADPAFLQLLCTPALSKRDRCQVLEDSLGEQVHPYVLNFLKILTEKGYLRHFSGCCQRFRQQYHRDNGILPVTAVTGLPLSPHLRQKLAAKLSAVTGKTILLECRVDPACLGGIRLELADMQVDGTLRHRLDEIGTMLKNTAL